jgi:amino-acid N-acetyltransferase
VSTQNRVEGPRVLVREATAADLAAASRLIREAGLPLDGLETAALMVAEADGRVIGSIALERHGSGPAMAFLLRSAAVDPAWRGRGVGAALTSAVLDRVDSAGAPVALLTETAADYFPRFGFALIPRSEMPAALAASAELTGACPASARAMLRPAGR